MYLVNVLVVLFCSLCAIYGNSIPGSKPRVVVIGAGAAGLAAATKLLENEFDVTVLEAEPRIGGRIHTLDFADGPVDLGAQFCDVKQENIVTKMGKDLNLLSHTPAKIHVLTTKKQYYEDDLIHKARDVFLDIYKNLNNSVISEGEFFIRYKKAVREKFSDEEQQKSAIALFEALDSIPLSVIVKDFYVWKNHGYKIFLDVLMKNYPNKTTDFDVGSKIQTEKVVEKINWGGEEVILKCQGGEEVKADYVIFTPSLGVLKEKHGEMFEPGLPKSKVKAIDTMDFNSCVVVYLHFPQAWWPKEFPGYALVWYKEDIEKIKEFKQGSTKNGYAWLFYVNNIYSVEGNPNVLQIWFHEDLASEIEEIDDQVLIDGIDFLFKKFLPPSTNILRPDKILRSNWYSNPHFRGGYSHPTSESLKMKNPSSFELLMQPLMKDGMPVVMFAGEATNPQNFSSVPGAVETGWREANRLIEFINKKK